MVSLRRRGNNSFMRRKPRPPLPPVWPVGWSNPDGITDSALIQNVLLLGTFAYTLEVCSIFGTERVRSEWDVLLQGHEDVTPRLVHHITRQLRNIASGFAIAEQETHDSQGPDVLFR